MYAVLQKYTYVYTKYYNCEKPGLDVKYTQPLWYKMNKMVRLAVNIVHVVYIKRIRLSE